MEEQYILSIAGSDSCAGAGIQADVKTAAALGVHAACAVTCVTAQNTSAFTALEPVSPSLAASQIEAAFADMPIGAVKIGMLGSAKVAQAVAEALEAALRNNPGLQVVLDPVVRATVAAESQDPEADKLNQTICRSILPLATLVTPNIPEARLLAGYCSQMLRGRTTFEGEPMQPPQHGSEKDVSAWAARLMCACGTDAVLVKGGHGQDSETCTDLLFVNSNSQRASVRASAPERCDFTVNVEVPVLDARMRVPVAYTSRRLPGEFHGTGCTLSTAIACRLASGDSLPDAVAAARTYLLGCMERAARPGQGSLLLGHVK